MSARGSHLDCLDSESSHILRKAAAEAHPAVVPVAIFLNLFLRIG